MVLEKIFALHLFWAPKNWILEAIGKQLFVYSCIPRHENICSRDVGSFYLVGGWIIYFRKLTFWASYNVLKFFILIEIFGNSLYLHFDAFISDIESPKFSRQSGLQGKDVAKFTYFQYKIIWPQNNKLIMGSFKKYLTCIITFFIPRIRVTLFQFYSTTSPVLFTKNNKLWNQWKDDFLSIWLLQRITLYHTKKKIASLDPMYGINNPYWQSSECLIQYTNWSLAC